VEVRTLIQLRAEARYLADAEGDTDRHPDADVTRRVNSAIRAYRAKVTANGLPYFVEQTAATTLTGTAVTGEQYSEVPWPVGPPRATQILGVDVASSTTADDWRELQVVTWGSRRRVGRGGSGGYPGWFAIRRVPTANPADLDAVREGSLVIFPAQTAGAYSISYLPDHVDLVADADLFVALPEGVQWIVQQVVRELSERDDDVHETYAIATQRQAEAWAVIQEAASRAQSAGPILPRRRGPSYPHYRFR
jgi:hypothetical protein